MNSLADRVKLLTVRPGDDNSPLRGEGFCALDGRAEGGIEIGTTVRTPVAGVEGALAAVTDELAGARLDPEGVLRTALATLSKLRAGTWIARS